MRAFITGGTGCVGANLVASLSKEGITTRILRRASSSVAALAGLAYEEAIGDVLDSPSQLAQAMEDCEWVFHAAGTIHGQGTIQSIYRTNVDGTKNMLEAARLAGARRFVFTGSLSALGVSSPGQLLNEDSKYNLPPEFFPYGRSKVLAEAEVLRAADSGLAAVVLNPATIVGARDVNMHGGSMVFAAAKGRLRFYPSGGSSFIGVDDLVAGHIAAAERGRSGERYILGGENLSYQQAFSLACKVAGRSAPRLPIPSWAVPSLAKGVQIGRAILGGRVPIDAYQMRMSAKTLYADTSKAVKELGLPQSPLESAIRSAYDWYREQGSL
jgi:dihydroflavonol-4-reductase